MLDYLSLIFLLMALLPTVAMVVCIIKDKREKARWLADHYYCVGCGRWKECRTHRMTKCPINW